MFAVPGAVTVTATATVTGTVTGTGTVTVTVSVTVTGTVTVAAPDGLQPATRIEYPPFMPSNVEIKAKLRDREGVEILVRERADHGPELIVQEDVFFPCESGRLKLRTFSDGCGELIFYRRLDTEGPTESEFFKAPTSDPEAMAAALGVALGTAGVVRKRRTLYLVGQTRVHLDEVEGLGHWLELEVVLEPNQSADEGARIARELMQTFGVRGDDLEANAYIDLVTGRTEVQP